jgi:acyl-CoA synthetase (AMP-forming)/AMP-acid ligase II
VGANDCVAIELPNGPEMAVAFLAVASAAVCAPLNPACRFQECEFLLSNLGATRLMILSGTDTAAAAVARRRSIPVLELSPLSQAAAGIFSLAGEAAARPVRDDRGQTAVALMLHTSGTTARPKLVPLKHAHLIASASNIAASLDLSAEDRCLNMMPLFHIHGLVGAVLSSLSEMETSVRHRVPIIVVVVNNEGNCGSGPQKPSFLRITSV